MTNTIKVFLIFAVTLCAYAYGYRMGKNNEELANARDEISTLSATLARYQSQRERDSAALVSARAAESHHSAELAGLRRQLEELKRLPKGNADRRCTRELELGVEGGELLRQAQRAIKFCEENHR